jgi:hypothetical protein
MSQIATRENVYHLKHELVKLRSELHHTKKTVTVLFCLVFLLAWMTLLYLIH